MGTGAAAALWTPFGWSPERAAALERTLRGAISPDGTTLLETLVRSTPEGYSRLVPGPGWPTLERRDLAGLDPGRVDRRVPIACFVHLTDVHVIDAQSPGRVEYLDDVSPVFSAAFRPQELLTTQVQTSMVHRIRDLRVGPITGRRFDCAVSTGDNIDNQQHNELDWFIGVLDGGPVRPDSGGDGYEGVQLPDWTDDRYWHPDRRDADRYGRAGFPVIDGLLDGAVAGFESPGLDIAWYSTYGNHDGLLQGNLARSDQIDRLLVGDRKITGSRDANPIALIATFATDAASVPERIATGELQARQVTPDDARRTVTTAEWVRKHLDSRHAHSPTGHGYDESHLDGRALYYRFDLAPGVIGLSLDTGGYNSGSIGESQLRWLESELAEHDDHLAVIFSHFTEGTMTGSVDPTRPDERRVQGAELTATLLRHRNVVAWVNGHTHSNAIRAVRNVAGDGGFWEITTASHVDFPEQARIIELVDNGDGTLSIFTTMIEHAAPASSDYDDLSPTGLASLSRELSANNDVRSLARQVGDVTALNCELALPAPFRLDRLSSAAAGAAGAHTGDRPARPRTGATDASGDSSEAYAAVGTGLGIGVGALAVGGALALRRRGERQPS